MTTPEPSPARPPLNPAIRPGLAGEARITVGAEHLAPHTPKFSTPAMVMLIEQASYGAVYPFLHQHKPSSVTRSTSSTSPPPTPAAMSWPVPLWATLPATSCSSRSWCASEIWCWAPRSSEWPSSPRRLPSHRPPHRNNPADRLLPHHPAACPPKETDHVVDSRNRRRSASGHQVHVHQTPT